MSDSDKLGGEGDMYRLRDEQVAFLPKPAKPLETAWDVCEAVCEAISNEPLRYNQENWIATRSKAAKVQSEVPMCGTVGCRAGWMAEIFLMDRLPTQVVQFLADEVRRDSYATSPAIAKELLGVNEEDAPEWLEDNVKMLFDGSALEEENREGDDDDVDMDEGYVRLPDEGTPAYARLGVKGLRAFMNKHEVWLRNRKLADVDMELIERLMRQ